MLALSAAKGVIANLSRNIYHSPFCLAYLVACWLSSMAVLPEPLTGGGRAGVEGLINPWAEGGLPWDID